MISAGALRRLQAQLCAALRRHLRDRGQPDVPEAGRLIWRIFWAISAARGFHQFGPAPISFAEIEAWARLTRTPLQPHHVAIIRAMDQVFLEHFALSKSTRRSDGVRELPRGSGHALTPALFDAALG